MVRLGGLQKIGRALMTPIAVMPAAALLLRLGSGDIQDLVGVTKLEGTPREVGVALFNVIGKAGGAVFENLPLLFAIGVAIGLAGGEGVAGLAALVGYVVLISVLGGMTPLLVQLHMLPEGGKIDMGVFAGILIGVIAARLYEKYKGIKLPDYLQFFGGRRFVPIVTAFSALAAGVALAFIWPPIQGAIARGGNWMAASGALGVFVYGTLNRLLLPFGLHHILNSLVWFAVGDFTGADGVVAHGDLTRFFAGDPSAGIFMAGFYPVMMFGLPAACWAMTRAAKLDRRKAIAGVLGSAALTSMITGVTEPIEFAFMFLAPPLYVAHALLTGAALVIANALEIKHGFGFSAGLIDYVLSYGLATKPSLLLPIGVAYGAVYYVLFSAIINRFNLATPGREPEAARKADESAGGDALADQAEALCRALGGRANITELDACITRLRLEVIEEDAVDEAALKACGAHGVVRLGDGKVQVVVGALAELLCEQMKTIPVALQILSPFTGKVVGLEDVPDATFSKKMMGDGLAVDPTSGEVVAPVSGELVALFPTGHAFGIRMTGGLEILVHIGINTVELKGEGFTTHKSQGDIVQAGETIVTFDLEACKKKAPSLISPVIVTNMEFVSEIGAFPGGDVTAGQKLFEVALI